MIAILSKKSKNFISFDIGTYHKKTLRVILTIFSQSPKGAVIKSFAPHFKTVKL